MAQHRGGFWESILRFCLPQQQKMDGIAQIGRKLHLKEPFAAFALIGQEKQSGSQESDELHKHVRYASRL